MNNECFSFEEKDAVYSEQHTAYIIFLQWFKRDRKKMKISYSSKSNISVDRLSYVDRVLISFSILLYFSIVPSIFVRSNSLLCWHLSELTEMFLKFTRKIMRTSRSHQALNCYRFSSKMTLFHSIEFSFQIDMAVIRSVILSSCAIICLLIDRFVHSISIARTALAHLIGEKSLMNRSIRLRQWERRTIYIHTQINNLICIHWSHLYEYTKPNMSKLPAPPSFLLPPPPVPPSDEFDISIISQLTCSSILKEQEQATTTTYILLLAGGSCLLAMLIFSISLVWLLTYRRREQFDKKQNANTASSTRSTNDSSTISHRSYQTVSSAYTNTSLPTVNTSTTTCSIDTNSIVCLHCQYIQSQPLPQPYYHVLNVPDVVPTWNTQSYQWYSTFSYFWTVHSSVFFVSFHTIKNRKYLSFGLRWED